MTKQTNKVELAKLDANNIAELDGWKEQMTTAVKDFPFVEITDSKSYEIAKKHRTGLKTARTDVQKQDKLIGSFITGFRKKTMEIASGLIDIVKPSEEKQQAEIDRWEKILEEKRNEEQRKEEQRVADHHQNIQTAKEHIDLIIGETTIKNKEDQEQKLKDLLNKLRENDFEEFQPLIDDVIREGNQKMMDHGFAIETAEEERQEQIKRDQLSAVNKYFRDATDLIDEATLENKDKLIPGIEILLADLPVMTNDDVREELKIIDDKIKAKANEKIIELSKEEERQKQIRKEESRNRITNVREGAMDLIYQLTVDNYEELIPEIEKVINQQNPFPELEEEFEKMVNTVRDNYDQKMIIINQRIQDNEREEERIRETIDQRTKSRGLELERIGFLFTEQKTENVWTSIHYDDNVFESMVQGLSDEDWKEYFDALEQSVNDAKNRNKKLAERKKRLADDKQILTDLIEASFDSFIPLKSDFQNKEIFELAKAVQKSVDKMRNSIIERIEKF